jgi:hypothetical protein
MLLRLAVGFAALALIAGCQGSTEEAGPPTETTATTAVGPATTAASESDTTTQTEATTDAETTTEAEATTDEATVERVVREWSQHLNAEENDALARLFALPAIVAQAGGLLELTSYDEIAEWFAGLPCSGMVVSITVPAPDVAIAVFRLGDRPSSPCDGPGELAAAEFHFRDGKLIAWAQVAVPEEAQPVTEPTETTAVA